VLPFGIAGDTIPAAVRFAVYADNVVGSLVAALEAAFPMTARLLGPAAFQSAARSFVRWHPPQVPQLADYGGGFAESLLSSRQPAHAADLARFEWAWNRAYFAADAAVLDPAALGTVPPELCGALRFIPHPSVQALACGCAVLDLWQALCCGEGAPDLLPSAGYFLVLQPFMEVLAVKVTAGDLALLKALTAGATLGAAAEQACGAEPEFDLQASLLTHLRLGTFTGFDLTVTPPPAGPGA
jgi:hypothetical protein